MTTEKQVTETLQVTEATRKRPKKSDNSVIPEQLWSDPLADQPDSLSIFPGFFASACASLLRKTRKIYLIGIGGTGMAGIAEVLLQLGFSVRGSDLNVTPVTKRLQAMGARVYEGHAAEQVMGADLVVRSSAIKSDNPEIQAATSARIPILPRAQMLAELMRFKTGIAIAGTHGKTTTTSLVSEIFKQAELDPTYVIGGVISGQDNHAKLGAGSYLIAEADESDQSFLMLSPVMCVITNIDHDHLEAYGNDFEKLCDAFVEFVHRLPFYGVAVVCLDDPVVRAIIPRLQRRVVTYGFHPDADVHAVDFMQSGSCTCYKVMAEAFVDRPVDIVLNLQGRHNAQNSLAAVALALLADIEVHAIQMALSGFAGIDRRLDYKGLWQIDQKQFCVFDDYGHHPNEVAATIDALRGSYPDRRLVMVFQPHRYSRTHALLDAFASVLSTVDVAVILDVYAAGEAPIAGASSADLCRLVREQNKSLTTVLVEDNHILPDKLAGILEQGDIVVMQGAGDISRLTKIWLENLDAPAQKPGVLLS